MASKNLLFLGLLLAIILVISSDVVSARNNPETKEGVEVDGWHGGEHHDHGHYHHHHHHCHYPHCGDEKKDENDHEDGHYKHKCKNWPHC